MKKKAVLILVLGVLLAAPCMVTANTSITGQYGYFTTPVAATPGQGVVRFATGYIFDPGNLYVAVNTAFLPNWEVSVAKEILTGENAELGWTPFVIGTKYTFYGAGGRSFKAAAGMQVELMSEEAGVDGTPFTLYAVVSDQAGQLGYVSLGVGYTLGVDAGYLINFFTNIKTPIISDKLFFVGEFTNYSPRLGRGLAWDMQRGIFNAGVVLELNRFVKFHLAGYDMLDEFLTIGLGGELRIKAF
jgi:hypothetical protein